MEDTICAISTNVGNAGAISIVRMSGPESIKIACEIFSNKKLKASPSHTIHYGYIMDNETKIDEVLLSLMKSPKTYTTEDIVEINCHGGFYTTTRVLELLMEHGARLANPGEFTERAFLNGRIDLIESEAISDLIEAKSEQARLLAMNGVSGNITKLIRSLRDQMSTLLANIELNIDYPEYEDEIVITKENITPRLKDIKEKLTRIIKESENGTIIKNGINIALIGRPNVGKSSILNALLEEEKAIVTNISGTTRDIIEGSFILNGIRINLMDTAGIHETEDIIEKIGVQKSKKALEIADLVILVLNNNEILTKEDNDLIKEVKKKNYLIFINKSDLSSKIKCEEFTKSKYIFGNTIEPTGLNQLKNKITELFHLNEMEQKDINFLSNARQVSLAKTSLKKIKDVEKSIEKNVPIDLLTTDLFAAWNNLGLITGDTYEEEFLDELFKKFCVGK